MDFGAAGVLGVSPGEVTGVERGEVSVALRNGRVVENARTDGRRFGAMRRQRVQNMIALLYTVGDQSGVFGNEKRGSELEGRNFGDELEGANQRVCWTSTLSLAVFTQNLNI